MSVPTSGHVRVVNSHVKNTGQLMQNILHASYGALIDTEESTLLDLVKAAVEALYSAWWGLMPQSDSVNPGLVYLRDGVTDQFDLVGEFEPTYSFTAVDDHLPAQTAGLVQTVTVGQGVRGKVYLPPPGEQSSDADGRPDTVAIARMVDFGSSLILTSTHAEGNVHWGVYSRKNNVYYNNTGYTVNALWATQRRRRAGVGV